MKKNLIITPAGKDSLFMKWLNGTPNFDLVLLFYDNDEELAKSYTKYTPHVFVEKGEKYHLIKSYIDKNLDFIKKYDYVWFPDDDILITTEEINQLFSISNEYSLWLSQPSMNGCISHHITLPVYGNLLRYTNFVEVLAPLFSLETLLKVYPTFKENYSSHGYDFLWPHLLGQPKDKIAILDSIVMTHTKPVGANYSRFPVLPEIELKNILDKYNLDTSRVNYSQIPL
jgi:hypothetical protein